MKNIYFPIPKPKSPRYKEMIPVRRTIDERTAFYAESDAFVDYAARLGVEFSYEKDGFIEPIYDVHVDPGAYRLEMGKRTVILRASDGRGMNRAYATLLQLFALADGEVSMPDAMIIDEPDCEYRGLMVDLGRVFKPFELLLDYVDMCYFYKLSTLHLHFTDDRIYSLPSKRFPKLTTEGKCYTEEQIKMLAEYAEERGVSIMPEIDVPGHCTPFVKNYPEVFGKGRLIDLTKTALDGIKDIFCELCDMFPYSRMIHIGGDEAAIDDWCDHRPSLEYAESAGIEITEDRRALSERMLAEFISVTAGAVFEKGRIPVVWEGFRKEVNEFVSRDIVVMSWENYYQLTPDLLDAGFEVINCAWLPMYIVEPLVVRDTRLVYDWSVYKWGAVHPESPILKTGYETEEDDAVLGGQLLVWSDAIEGHSPSIAEGIEKETEHLIERLPYLAENAWNASKRTVYDTFSTQAQLQTLKLRRLLRSVKK